jgi:nucleotide-binding universal stress UspA family protein
MYQHILLPVGGSSTSDDGLEEAIKLAQVTGGRVRLLHVAGFMPLSMNAEGYGAVSSDVRRIALESAAKILAEAEAKAKVEQGGVAVDAVLREGSADRLVEHVADRLKTWGADLIILGTHGRHGLGRLLMGSHAEEVLRTATVPVLLVNALHSVTARRESDDSRPAAALARVLGG